MFSINSDLNHTKNNKMVTLKKVICALSKLVYLKTKLLELLESSMEMPEY